MRRNPSGKIRVLTHELDVDLLTIAGHKVYAPKGVGALFVRRGTALQPVLSGADHEAGLRPGTENTPYIVGLGCATLLAAKDLEVGSDLALLDDGSTGVCSHEANPCGDCSRPKVATTPQHLVDLPAWRRGPGTARPLSESAASTGSACHSGAVNMSSTLAAMGVTRDVAAGTGCV